MPAGDRASPGQPGDTASALPAGLVQAAGTPPPAAAQGHPRPPGSHGRTSLTPRGGWTYKELAQGTARESASMLGLTEWGCLQTPGVQGLSWHHLKLPL